LSTTAPLGCFGRLNSSFSLPARFSFTDHGETLSARCGPLTQVADVAADGLVKCPTIRRPNRRPVNLMADRMARPTCHRPTSYGRWLIATPTRSTASRFRFVHDPSLADDVVQETIIKAWRHSPVERGQAIPRSWLLKVAHNTAISILRTRREDLRGPDTLPEAPGEIETDRRVEGMAQLDELWKAMRHLPEPSRVLIALREVDGLSYEEMSETLDLPIPTIKTRLFRARRQLKDALKEWR